MIGLVQVSDQALADRYSYVPTIGLFIVLVWGGADLAERIHLSILFRAVVVAVVVILCTVLSGIQVEYWRSDKALWEHALAVTDNNSFAHLQLGLTYSREGKYALTERETRAALAIDPETPRLQYAYASVLQRLGRFEEALAGLSQGSPRRRPRSYLPRGHRQRPRQRASGTRKEPRGVVGVPHGPCTVSGQFDLSLQYGQRACGAWPGSGSSKRISPGQRAGPQLCLPARWFGHTPRTTGPTPGSGRRVSPGHRVKSPR